MVDNKRRLHYPVVTQHTVSDMGNPCMVVIVGEPEGLDCGNLEHTDLSDQMALDFTTTNTDLTEEMEKHGENIKTSAIKF